MGIFNKLKEKVRETIEETKTSIRETVDNLRYDRLKEIAFEYAFFLSQTPEGKRLVP